MSVEFVRRFLFQHVGFDVEIVATVLMTWQKKDHYNGFAMGRNDSVMCLEWPFNGFSFPWAFAVEQQRMNFVKRYSSFILKVSVFFFFWKNKIICFKNLRRVLRLLDRSFIKARLSGTARKWICRRPIISADFWKWIACFLRESKSVFAEGLLSLQISQSELVVF